MSNGVLPPGKPIFLDPEKAKDAQYVDGNADTPPTFDEELGIRPAEGADVPQGTLVAEPEHKTRVRWREVARLHAMGMTNTQICDRLNYTPSWVSTLLKYPEVRTEVERYRQKLFDQDVTSALKDLGPDAVAVISQMLHAKNEKLRDRAELAKWLAEKITGKPKQEVDHTASSLSAFTDLLKQMQSVGEPLRASNSKQPDTIDVTPTSVTESSTSDTNAPSKWSGWGNSNLK